MKNRAQRRADTERVKQKRYSKWKCLWEGMDERRQGQLRKTNFSCGCTMCKPWKHGNGPKMKMSDRKRAENE